MSPAESESELIARLLELSPAERVGFVRRACREHAGLRERLRDVAAMLGEDEDAPSEPPVPVSDGERQRALELALMPPENASSVVGPYKLLEKIGEGGFGVVWMAEQHEPVRRRVALKVIKSGMDTREVIARFEAERQALALMDHPNIARVFDAGETDSGRPYFVMELVRGTPITKYCDDHRVTTDERLRLFVAVCHAVQHAHQKGIIHRDLKPSNILVTLHDGVPVPKVIDFGIAKAIETPLTPKTLFTQFHAFIGTPAYTSPEQMEMTGLDVDTRSDIYSLGVLLYELLAGRPPFEPDDLLKSGLEEMRRRIREVEPPRPSHRVRTLAGELRSTIAQQRGTDGAKLSVLLRGDLDWIVMHSLEKDRTRRYATANDFADDIRHFLAHEPVNARPPSTIYRVTKFVRRHRIGVTAGAIVALALVGGTVVSTIALLGESAARRREQALHAEASRAAARSDQIAQFMKDMLAGIDPNVARGRDNSVLREILETTRPQIDAKLGDQPEVVADLRSTFASVYTSIADYATAEKLLLQAIPVLREAQPPRPAELATALDRLGLVLKYSNRAAEAQAAFQEAVDLRLRLYGREHRATAEALYNLSKAVSDLKRRREIRTEVLDIYSRILPPDAAELGHTIFGIGSVTNEEGDVPRAIELFRQALELRRRALGPDHPSVAEALQSLGLCEVGLGRPDGAVPYFRAALELRRRVLGANPEVVSTLLRLNGVLPAAAAAPADVEAADAVVAAQRAVLPRMATEFALALLVRASFTEFRERLPEKAAQMRAEAMGHLAASARDGIPTEPRLLRDIILFSDWKMSGGATLEAVAMFEAWSVLIRGMPPSERRNEELRTNLFFRGVGLYSGGRFAEASEMFRECLMPLRLAASSQDLRPQISRSIWSECLLASGRSDEAWALMEPFLPSVTGTPLPPSLGPAQAIGAVFYQIGRCALQRGDLALAEAAFQRAREGAGTMESTRYGKLAYPPQRFDSALGLMRARQGRFREAEELCQAALDGVAVPRAWGKHLASQIIDEIRANLTEVRRLAAAAGGGASATSPSVEAPSASGSTP